ncbi:MFS transporter [Natronolimnohabitans innermongolicus]|uniref:Major facilitator superfamily protein n=1 Tax=Natronolimnohabitans innermongolicus JCM 12255 TaxID=1227499 RepID=L9WPU4_9EURY|nr:MFS transporter [Natronolimnohabitans innermongolicus]ELY50368.1 major facilitator superfamily protein [Natronolimnohabitans innermongolicus JCM 12255]
MALIALGSVASQIGWLVLPPLLPSIIDDLGISAVQAGVALTLLTLFAAGGRYPGGRIADQLSRKTALGICFLAWIIGFSILAVATTYPLFLLGVSVAGVGIGMYVPAAFAQLSDLFVRKRGQAFGVNNAAYNLAGTAAPGLAFVVLLVGPWRLSFALLVGLLLVLAFLVHSLHEEEYVVRRLEFGFTATVARTVFDPQVRLVLIAASLVSFVWNGSISFLPIFLETERGVSTQMAGVAFAGLFLVGVATTPTTGWVGDRIGPLPTILGTLCAASIGLVAMTVSTSTAGIMLGVGAFAVGLLGFWPVMTAYMMAIVPEESKGGDYGAIGTVYAGVGSLGPTFAGTMGQYGSYTTAYVGFVGCLVVCLAIVLYARAT